MVKLRLKRAGKKRAAFYRIVASDVRVKRDGKYIELIGTYNPINGEVNVKKDIALKWLQQGAQPTDTVRNILSKEGVMVELHNAKLEANKTKPKKVTEKKASTPKKTTSTKKVVASEGEGEAKKAAPKKTATKKASTAKVTTEEKPVEPKVDEPAS